MMHVKHTIAASLIGILLVPVASRAENALVSPGALSQSIQREAVRLASARTAAGPPPQHRSWAARHPIALGAILGIVTGGAIAQISDRRVTDSDGRPIFLAGAVPGLVIGSSIGAIVAFARD
jgi:hypothetical protein